ncbi:hypothetical protein WICPIJ_001927 [Wickerhamomyces pijperi]|uniref:Uncharacterized protein n=1 Tax=Wickerhamomyces pijperi TaxID=599730 RepID=A0A9P8QA27_WICPI|nr:hypothetical protein WICPIJ_001927 [Wickerhamomyces pijperi]
MVFNKALVLSSVFLGGKLQAFDEFPIFDRAVDQWDRDVQVNTFDLIGETAGQILDNVTVQIISVQVCEFVEDVNELQRQIVLEIKLISHLVCLLEPPQGIHTNIENGQCNITSQGRVCLWVTQHVQIRVWQLVQLVSGFISGETWHFDHIVSAKISTFLFRRFVFQLLLFSDQTEDLSSVQQLGDITQLK